LRFRIDYQKRLNDSKPGVKRDFLEFAKRLEARGCPQKSWQLAVVLRNAETLKKEIAWGLNCLIIHLKYKNYCQLDVN